MDGLCIEHFRCFRESKSVPLAPLTLLVGENSTGKTSFLAATRLAWDLAFGQARLNFNDEPFSLGSYDQIANYAGGTAGRSKDFVIGMQVDIPDRAHKSVHGLGPQTLLVKATLRSGVSEPLLSSLHLKYFTDELLFNFRGSENESSVTLVSGDENKRVPFQSLKGTFPIQMITTYGVSIFFWNSELLTRTPGTSDVFSKSLRDAFERIRHAYFWAHGQNSDRPYAIAPVQTKPQRTYNPLTDVPAPDGGHVPMLLAKISLESRSEWGRIQSAVEEFGANSGLFRRLTVKRLGKKGADPFQLAVKISGPPSNLIDVGYGVSQILPVLVDTLNEERERIFLLQQPEVHLHPRAQAEIGSYLVNLVERKKHQFVVETHSDYLLDRIRMELRDRQALSPKDVVILFFERVGSDVNIHPIRIEKSGNLEGVPKGYRKFFLHEDRRLLGMAGDVHNR